MLLLMVKKEELPEASLAQPLGRSWLSRGRLEPPKSEFRKRTGELRTIESGIVFLKHRVGGQTK
jgi:hypothetical protein